MARVFISLSTPGQVTHLPGIALLQPCVKAMDTRRRHRRTGPGQVETQSLCFLLEFLCQGHDTFNRVVLRRIDTRVIDGGESLEVVAAGN